MTTSDAQREKQFVAVSSAGAALVLTGAKLGVGIWTGSLGLLSEAAHSGLDLVWAGQRTGRAWPRHLALP